MVSPWSRGPWKGIWKAVFLVALLTVRFPCLSRQRQTGRGSRAAFVVENLRYGPGPAQIGDLLRPGGGAGAGGRACRGVVVLVHGGFWKAVYTRSLMVKLAQDLVSRGLAVWNIEYRSVGSGGGYPRTLQDVSLAVDWLAGDQAAQRGVGPGTDGAGPPIALVGHSAGGHLASWLGLRPFLASPEGAAVAPRVRAVVSQAGVVDLAAAYERDLGYGAVRDFMGTPPKDYDARLRAAWNGAILDPFGAVAEDADQRYRRADPVAVVRAAKGSLRVAQLPIFGLVHGTDDENVPKDQSQALAEAFASIDASERVRVRIVEGEGHFEHLDPGSGCWGSALDVLSEAFGAKL